MSIDSRNDFLFTLMREIGERILIGGLPDEQAVLFLGTVFLAILPWMWSNGIRVIRECGPGHKNLPRIFTIAGTATGRGSYRAQATVNDIPLWLVILPIVTTSLEPSSVFQPSMKCYVAGPCGWKLGELVYVGYGDIQLDKGKPYFAYLGDESGRQSGEYQSYHAPDRESRMALRQLSLYHCWRQIGAWPHIFGEPLPTPEPREPSMFDSP